MVNITSQKGALRSLCRCQTCNFTCMWARILFMLKNK